MDKSCTIQDVFERFYPPMKRGVTLLLITEKRLITSETVKQEFLV